MVMLLLLPSLKLTLYFVMFYSREGCAKRFGSKVLWQTKISDHRFAVHITRTQLPFLSHGVESRAFYGVLAHNSEVKIVIM